VYFPFDLHSAAVSDSHLPCRAHAILDNAILPQVTAHHGRRETACGLLARVRLLSATTRNSTKVVIRRLPISDASDQCETKHRLSWPRKRVVAAHYKKDDLLHCWTSSSDIFGYYANFHEGHGTIGAGHGRGRAWARQGMCELMQCMAGERHGNGMGAAWVRHGHGMLRVNRPLFGLRDVTDLGKR
jgi:hypothetical protein